jgi:chromatin modification-related protein YNG2
VQNISDDQNRHSGVGPRFSGYNPISQQVLGEQVYCFCQNISYGDMVACDYPNCKYEWFHFPCVGLTKKPDTNYGDFWYCIECLEKVKKLGAWIF